MPRPPPVVPFIQTGNPEMDRLQRFVTQALPGKQDRWSAPMLLNGWVNFPGNQPAGYMKDSLGFVHLRGSVKSGAAVTIFTLPVGYRPSGNCAFAVDASAAYGRILVTTSGDVKLDVGSGAANAQMDGINFDTR